MQACNTPLVDVARSTLASSDGSQKVVVDEVRAVSAGTATLKLFSPHLGVQSFFWKRWSALHVLVQGYIYYFDEELAKHHEACSVAWADGAPRVRDGRPSIESVSVVLESDFI